MTAHFFWICTAIFNGLMISGQPGRHRIGTIGVTKLVKYYTALALAVLLRVCMWYVLNILAVYNNNVFEQAGPASQPTWLFTNTIHYD